MEGDTSVLIIATNYEIFRTDCWWEAAAQQSKYLCMFPCSCCPWIIYLFALSVTMRAQHRAQVSHGLCVGICCAHLCPSPVLTPRSISCTQRGHGLPWELLGPGVLCWAGLSAAAVCCGVAGMHHWLVIAHVQCAGQRWKLWFTKPLCYFCPCFRALWCHFLDRHRLAPSLTIHGAQSIHPHFLPDLSLSDGRGCPSHHQSLHPEPGHLVPAGMGSSPLPRATQLTSL